MVKRKTFSLMIMALIFFGLLALSGCESAEEQQKKEVDLAYARVSSI